MQQIRIAVISNAGGSGKTTIASHIAYLLGRKGHSVCLIDLDPQGSLNLFCGVQNAETATDTIAAVLADDDFADRAHWPLIDCWSDHLDKVQLCRGGMVLVETQQHLVIHQRGGYLLRDRLEDSPLPHEVVIIDCPATLGTLTRIALSACTHVLIPIQLQPKALKGSAELLSWYFRECKQLRIEKPEIIGYVPNQYDKSRSIERQILQELPRHLERFGVSCFPPVRNSAYFARASAAGLPIHLYQPGIEVIKDFRALETAVCDLVA